MSHTRNTVHYWRRTTHFCFQMPPNAAKVCNETDENIHYDNLKADGDAEEVEASKKRISVSFLN